MGKILIADTLEIFREGLRSIIHSIDDGIECIEVTSYEGVISNLSADIDVLLIEHCDQFRTLQIIKSMIICKETKVIVLSSNNSKHDLKEFLQLNVYGYLKKDSTKLALQQTITAVLKNEKFFCPFVMDILLSKSQTPKQTVLLTDREKEITKFIVVGCKNKEIANQLNLSPHTIHTHRKNILRKTGVSSALELSIFAKENGLF